MLNYSTCSWHAEHRCHRTTRTSSISSSKSRAVSARLDFCCKPARLLQQWRSSRLQQSPTRSYTERGKCRGRMRMNHRLIQTPNRYPSHLPSQQRLNMEARSHGERKWPVQTLLYSAIALPRTWSKPPYPDQIT